MATSAPVPMAMPTSACGERGRVVDAVAGHGDPCALGLELVDDARLVLRQHLGADLVDAEPAGHRRAVRALSPVAMTMRRPSACSAAIAAGVVAFTGSATATSPASLPSTATNITVSARARRASAAGGKRRDAEARHHRRVAERHRPAVDRPARPCR